MKSSKALFDHGIATETLLQDATADAAERMTPSHNRHQLRKKTANHKSFNGCAIFTP